MKKRIFLIVLTLCLAMTLLPTTALAAKSDVSANAAGYYDVVNNAKKRTAYEGKGMLYDLNGDGFEELILLYFTKKDVPYDGSIPYLVCSVYTKVANKVVPMWEEKEIYADAGGPHADLGPLLVNGKVYMCEYQQGGNATGPSPYERVNFHGGYKLYSMSGSTLVEEPGTHFEYTYYNDNKGNKHIVSSSAQLFGRNVSYDEYLNWEKGLDNSLLLKRGKTAPGKSYTALLKDLKANEPTQKPTLGNFYDVPVGAYYYNAVKWAIDKNITNGTTDTTFGPNDSCNRAQAVTFLWRAAGRPEPKGGSGSFTDVPSGSYYSKAVQWAVEQGIVNGTGANTFSPDTVCDRGMIVTLLWRTLGKPAVSGGGSFTDVPESAYYSDAVKWAASKGISTGNGDGTFTPGSSCVRGMMVTFLYRAMA